MRTIDTVTGQTLPDLAIQEYGNSDAVAVILEDNPALVTTNDPDELDLAFDLVAGQSVLIREEDPIINKAVLRELAGATIATFN